LRLRQLDAHACGVGFAGGIFLSGAAKRRNRLNDAKQPRFRLLEFWRFIQQLTPT
jgi:hypothetical protein